MNEVTKSAREHFRLLWVAYAILAIALGVTAVAWLWARRQADPLLPKLLLLAGLVISGTLYRLAFIQTQARIRAEALTTELQKSADALRASEAQFRGIFESIQDVYYEVDLRGTIQQISPSCRLFGYEPTALIGHSVLELYADPADRDRLVTTLLATGRVNDYEVSLRDKAGRLRMISVTSTVLRDAVGNPAGSAGLLRDITDRKSVEAVLRRTQEQMHTILASAPVVLFALDQDGRFTLSEGRGLTAIGLRPGEVVGQSIYTVYRDVPDILDHVRRALQGDECSQVLTVNGVAFETWYSPLRNPAGTISGVIGVATNITERMMAEQALAAEKERLAVTLRSIGDAVVTTDADRRVVLMNRMAEEMSGWPQTEAAGRPVGQVLSLLAPRTRQAAEDLVAAVLDHAQTVESAGPALWCSRSGLERLVTGLGSPIRDGSGATVGAVLVLRDVTESQKVEEERLRASKLESVGILAGGIAHDFNNILTAIIGNISMADLLAQPNGELRARLKEAEKACWRARDLTQQLLTFAKGGAPVREAAVLTELIRESARFATPGSKVQCEFDLPGSLWAVEADKGQISQVIQNIVMNADQAMPEGGVIRISARNLNLAENQGLDLEPGRYVCVSVLDHGTGIRPEHLPRIFDPYFTTKQRGSGLGLATAYSIVKRHDGAITVDSQLGTGSRFDVYLPASVRLAAPPPEAPGTRPRGQGRILIMDDEPLVLSMVRVMLKRLGYEPVTAKEGEEAVRLYAEADAAGRPFAAVILDLTVPGGMGGKETIKRLLAFNPDVKAIVCSGYSQDPVMANHAAYGFRAMVSKPYLMDQLAEALDRVLSQNPAPP